MSPTCTPTRKSRDPKPRERAFAAKRSRISIADRTASSVLVNSASTASPMNLTTRPPRSPTAWRANSWSSSTTATASPSFLAESSVYPAMSAKQTAARQ
jgi:hypothetical protein